MTSIDQIATTWLANRNYPRHWYIDAILGCCEFIREASLHTEIIPMASTVITLNDRKAGPLPCGYRTWVRVGRQAGQAIQGLATRERLRRDVAVDPATGANVPHGTSTPDGFTYGAEDSSYWIYNRNKWGEDTNGYFGGFGDDGGTFKVFIERNEIQLLENWPDDNVYMDYIVSVENVDSATKLREECLPAAVAFIEWFIERNKRNKDGNAIARAEARYWSLLRILRAELFDYGITDIADIFYRSVKASIK